MTRGIGLEEERNTFRKKRFAAAASRLAVSQEIDSLPGGVHRPIQILLLTLNLYICLVDTVAFVGLFKMGPTALVQFRGVCLHPSPDAARVCLESALRQQFGYMLV